MSTLAPGKRSENPLIRVKMASRLAKRPRGSSISQSSVNAPPRSRRRSSAPEAFHA